MGENGNTAEQELLKTIEGKNPIPVKKTVKKASRKIPLVNMQALVPQVTEGVKNFFFDGGKQISFGSINTILVGVAGVMALWWSIVAVQGVQYLGNVPRFKVSAESLNGMAEDFTNLKDYAYYVSVLVNRNIFMPVAEQQEVAEVVQQEVDRKPQMPNVNDIMRLVGISWAEIAEKRYVMIEDLKAQITYYLKEGEKVLEFKISEILEDRVMLKFGDEEVELK